MHCDECKKNPAVIHYESMANGIRTVKDLCSECAAKYGLGNFSPFSLGDLFPHAASTAQDQIRCEKCGLSLMEFKRIGLVGCQQCYKDLKIGVDPILRQVQKGLRHIGRSPNESTMSQNIRVNTIDTSIKEIDRKELKREKLRKEMNNAVSEEDFERAARLRDELKALDN